MQLSSGNDILCDCIVYCNESPRINNQRDFPQANRVLFRYYIQKNRIDYRHIVLRRASFMILRCFVIRLRVLLLFYFLIFFWFFC